MGSGFKPVPGGPNPRRGSSAPAQVNKAAVAQLRVLLVDNLVAWRQKMRGWLADVGTSQDAILEAASGEEAMEVLRGVNFDVDVLVCEWDDESVGGGDLVVQLKNNAATSRIGFVAMVGNDAAAIREAKAAGVTEVLVKPITPVAMLQALSTIQKTLKPRTEETRKRQQAAASIQPQSTKLSSTIASELRGAGKLGRYKLGGVIAAGPSKRRLYWVESGTVFVRELRSDGTQVEYRATPGRFFGEAAFVGAEITEPRAVTESEVIVGWQEAEAVGQTMVRLPILQHYFRTITVERHRNNVVIDLQDESPGAIGGTLESLPFPDLMQMMTVTKKTGVLKIESAGDQAVLHIYGGALRHAELGRIQGDEVVFRVVLWAGGRFLFGPQPGLKGPQTISTDVNFLLMEGIRRKELMAGGQKPT